MPDSGELAKLGITEVFPAGVIVVTDAETLVQHQDLLDSVSGLPLVMLASWLLERTKAHLQTLRRWLNLSRSIAHCLLMFMRM